MGSTSDLENRLTYKHLQVLFSDAGGGIEANLLAEGMDLQRCVWHGKRDVPYILYMDKVKKGQEPILRFLEANPLFHLCRQDLGKLRRKDEPLVRKLIRAIWPSFKELLAVLPSERYLKTSPYIENISRQAITFFVYWLDHKKRMPWTTNFVESAFGQVVNRIKKVGHR